MPLANDVTALLQRLLPKWDGVLRQAGLALNPANLAALRNPLPHIDRTVTGFEDFSTKGTRAVEPGDPALSLLYHAFASPNVQPLAAAGPLTGQDYPTLAELDLLENYIYSLAPLAAADLAGLVVAVFAYEYRPSQSTSHQLHADLMFSRTGVARVGSEEATWSARDRCHFGQAPGKPGSFAAMPARYGAFLARKVRGQTDKLSLVGNRDSDDDGRDFLFPVRKLFDGTECIAGLNLAVTFDEYHRCEKLNRIVSIGEVELKAGFDIGKAPMLRVSGEGDPLVVIRRVSPGGSILLSSPPAKIVRFAKQHNTVSGKDEVISFKVPSSGLFFRDFAKNRHYSTLMLVEDWWTLAPELIIGELSDAHPRIAPRNLPNFVNIRHEVRPNVADPVDLNEPGAIPGNVDYRKYISDGGYQAAMFEDSICDGSVTARVAGLPPALESHSAFSVVTAPDFFAFADELRLNNHVSATPDQFAAGGPSPLCEGRYPVNPAVLRPRPDGSPSLDQDDETLVAIVGRVRDKAASIQETRERGRTTSYLTDAASNVFAPGWDVTFCGSLWGKFYATYGLGSPFPEDVKLCAAANSFWPAAAPDASRTFQRSSTPTAIPMLDEELGYHPANPDKPPAAPAVPGWDGEYGPFFEYLTIDVPGQQSITERVVNFSDIWRSDYVRNALRGTFRPDPLLGVDSAELIARMDCMRFCIKKLPPSPHEVKNTNLWLITAQRVADWSTTPQNHGLTGAGYKFVFVEPTGDKAVAVETDPTRMHQRIKPAGYVCHVTPTRLFWSTDGKTFKPEYP